MATYKTGTSGYDDPEAITKQVQSTAQYLSPAGNLNYYSGAGSQGNTVSHGGQGDLTYDSATGTITRVLNGNAYPVYKGEAKYDSIYNEYISRYGQPVTNPIPSSQQNVVPEYNDVSNDAAYQSQIKYYQDLVDKLANTTYTPVDVEAQMAKTLTYEEAYELAKQIVEPQYQKSYWDAASTAAQNLERSGLYDSLYGQALSAQAQQNVSNDMNAAIGSLALNLQQMDYDQAKQIAEMMINENQFGANFNQSGLTSAAQGTMDLINSLIEQANAQNDFALQQASLQLQQRAQELERRYTEGQLTQMQYENEMMQLEIEAQRAKNNSVSVGSSGGISDISDITGDGDYQTIFRMIEDGGDSATIRNMITNAERANTLTAQQRQELLDKLINRDSYEGAASATNAREFQQIWAQIVTMKNNGDSEAAINAVLNNSVDRHYITEAQAQYIANNVFGA